MIYLFSDELFSGFVLSSKSHARLVSLDASEALAISGVVDFITSKDVPGNNTWMNDDDLVFVENEVIILKFFKCNFS